MTKLLNKSNDVRGESELCLFLIDCPFHCGFVPQSDFPLLFQVHFLVILVYRKS